MKNQNTKRYAVLAFIVLLSIPALAIGVIPASGQAVNSQQTYAFCVVNPNPAGLHQQVYVFMFLSNLQASAGGTGGARFHNFTCTITKPNGAQEVKGPYTADPVSSSYFSYAPDQLGNYTFVMHYPGEETPLTTGPGGTSPDTIFSASTSAAVTLVVQQNALPVLTGNPAPSNYWNRPANDQNFVWGPLANNWLMSAWDSTSRQFDQGSAYIPFPPVTATSWGSGPTSAHVLWTAPLTFGGLIGGEYGNAQFGDGRSYEQFFKPPVIISGRLYYNSIYANEPVTTVNYSSIVCVDMATGNTIFTIPNATLSFGQIYNYVSPNQAGGMPYLWEARGTNWRCFDPWTGNVLFTIANVPSGTQLLDNTFYGKSATAIGGAGSGDILVYGLSGNSSQRTIFLWNSSLCIPKLGDVGSGTNYWQWRPVNYLGMTLNGVGNTTFPSAFGPATARSTNGIQWNVTLDMSSFPGGTNGTQAGSILQVGYDNEIIIANGSTLVGTIFAQATTRTFAAYDMTTGAKLWGPTTIDFTQHTPVNGTLYVGSVIGMAQRNVGPDDIMPAWCKEVGAFYTWNIRTGQFLWGPSTPSATAGNGFALYNWECKLITPDGYLYNWGFDGMIHCFNLTTGTGIWDFSTGAAGLNTPYGTWPVYNGINVVNGLIYTQTSDHGNGVEPLYQGEAMYCVNYATGQEIYNMTGWFEQPGIADGRLVSHNCYDNQIYCIGKGPSATAVTVTPSIQNHGSMVMIQGSVSDISPGALNLVKQGVVNTVPLVSDKDQGRFMNYLYQQQALPTDATGVLVHLTAMQPDGTTKDLGYVTSDLSGHYALTWTPDQIGTYTITATFTGSNSYYSSSAETSIGMQNAPAPVVSPTATPPPTAVVTPTPATPTPPPTPIVTAPTVAPSPPASPAPVALYVGIAAVVIIIVIVAAALALRRRK